MAMDKEVREALKASTKARSQSEELADKLIGWLDELSDGISTIQNPDDVKRHLESIFSSTEYSADVKHSSIDSAEVNLSDADSALKKMGLA